MDRRWVRQGGGPALLGSSFRCSQGGRGRTAWAAGAGAADDCVVGGVMSLRTCGESAWISWHASHHPPPHTHLLFHLSPPHPSEGDEKTRQEGMTEINRRRTDGHQRRGCSILFDWICFLRLAWFLCHWDIHFPNQDRDVDLPE